MEEVLGKYQCGFKEERSVVDQTFTLRKTEAESYEFEKDTCLLFMDFNKDFDQVKSDKLCAALRELGVFNKVMNMIKLTFKKIKCCVRVENQLTESYRRIKARRSTFFDVIKL